MYILKNNTTLVLYVRKKLKNLFGIYRLYVLINVYFIVVIVFRSIKVFFALPILINVLCGFFNYNTIHKKINERTF